VLGVPVPSGAVSLPLATVLSGEEPVLVPVLVPLQAQTTAATKSEAMILEMAFMMATPTQWSCRRDLPTDHALYWRSRPAERHLGATGATLARCGAIRAAILAA